MDGTGIARVAGYASVFDVADAGRDVVRRGAFARALSRMAESKNSGVPLLWQHEAGEPVGVVERLAEDARGLRVVARIADTRRGREALALVRTQALSGLSFGYRVKRARATRSGRELLELELIEVSVVTFPMQPLARILGVGEVETA